jgi:hypothetical protein
MEGEDMMHDEMMHDEMMHDDMMHDGHHEKGEMDWDNVDIEQLDKNAAKEIARGEVDPMAGQLTFLLTAWGATIFTALDAFRYNKLEDVWCKANSAYEMGVADKNFCNAKTIGYYGNLAVWGILAITQTLSTLGIAAEINLMAWMYGQAVFGLIMLIDHGLRFMAFNTAHTKCND